MARAWPARMRQLMLVLDITVANVALPMWGHGFATEDARGVVDFAFGELGLDESWRWPRPTTYRRCEWCNASE